MFIVLHYEILKIVLLLHLSFKFACIKMNGKSAVLSVLRLKEECKEVCSEVRARVH